MSFTKYIVLLLSLSASASALASPHISRNVHHHRALAGRAASLVPDDVPFVAPRKRGLSRRCKLRHDGSSRVSSSAATPSVTATEAAVNAAPPPPEAKPTTTNKDESKATPKAAAATKAAEPKPEPKPEPEPKPKPAPQSDGGGNQPGFMTGTQTGQGTFYDTGLGACGITNKNTDFICAVSHKLFDNFPGYKAGNPNANPICNRKIRATFEGKSVVVIVTDRCEGCAETDLDFSPSAFNTIADPSLGRISGMKWVWE